MAEILLAAFAENLSSLLPCIVDRCRLRLLDVRGWLAAWLSLAVIRLSTEQPPSISHLDEIPK